jgi:hypothetical protein
MGVNLYNRERYPDPTVCQALNNIMREEKRKRRADSSECFSLEKGECTALKAMKCNGCSFYKTKEQNKADCEKALKRISTLGVGIIRHVMDKYYNGI